jgi:hypothetical protein
MNNAGDSERVLFGRLSSRAAEVLRENDLGESTKPAPRLYPHQWLWDSCFIAIGLRHQNPQRAAKEVSSLFRGQWDNGMLPHEIFNSGAGYHAGPDKWQSSRLPGAPKNIDTTGMTQPPMVAEAISRVAEKLSANSRQQFLGALLPGLIRYHEWLYRERDPEGTGLVTLIHPWEAGNEDTPHWSRMMHDAAPLRVKLLRTVKAEKILDRWRPDLKHAPAEVRPSTEDFYTLYSLFDRVRECRYDLAKVREAKNIPLVQDVLFNSILVRANHYLRQLAAEAKIEIPAALVSAMAKAPEALEELYDDGVYYSRDAKSGELIREISISSLAPLYAGTIAQARADEIVAKIQSKVFWPKYGIATVPTDSRYFNARRFWQGPVWVNTNWLLIDGLKRYGHKDDAARLQKETLAMVDNAGGMYEYYSPLDGTPAGTPSFSWTASLVLDIIADLRPKAKHKNN